MGVVEEVRKIVFRGIVDTRPETLAAAVERFDGKLAKAGLESGRSRRIFSARSRRWVI